MKLVENSAAFLPQLEGMDGVYKQIEICGRTCYKSEDKITEDSAKGFVDRMISSKHYAMLEHGTIYLEREIEYEDSDYNRFEDFYENSPYSKVVYDGGYCYVTTNLRVIVENQLLEDLEYMCPPREYHVKRYTFKVVTSIGVTRELNRHRANSIGEQSTRYCNYSSDKFDNQVSFCKPAWFKLNTGMYNYGILDDKFTTYIIGDGYLKSTLDGEDYNNFLRFCLLFEGVYMSLINEGWKPQEARELLPLCTATEAVYTAFADDWKHFFDLRLYESTGKVHPNMAELAEKIAEAAEKAGVLEDIMNNNNNNK